MPRKKGLSRPTASLGRFMNMAKTWLWALEREAQDVLKGLGENPGPPNG